MSVKKIPRDATYNSYITPTPNEWIYYSNIDARILNVLWFIYTITYRISSYSFRPGITSSLEYFLQQKFSLLGNKPERVFGLQVRCRELDIFKIRNFLRNCLKKFMIFSGFLGGIFWIFLGFFLEDFFGGFFWEEFFGRNFFGRIFWEEFFGRNFWEDFFRVILWEECFVYVGLSRFWFL